WVSVELAAIDRAPGILAALPVPSTPYVPFCPPRFDPPIHVHSPLLYFHKSFIGSKVPTESYPYPPKSHSFPEASTQSIEISRPSIEICRAPGALFMLAVPIVPYTPS